MHSRFARARAALAFGMIGVFTNAHAQSTNPTNELAEIVVTAEKRAQPIDKVGMTISAFSGPTLQAQGINNVADLAEIVPGLTYAHSNTGLPVYTLRGVGFYETSLAAYPAVSVYVDQVPLPFPLLTSHTTLDIERTRRAVFRKSPRPAPFSSNP
jgi:iron complex outermembrane recepter protein